MGEFDKDIKDMLMNLLGRDWFKVLNGVLRELEGGLELDIMIRKIGYLYGGTGGKNVREVINPWDYSQLRPKPEYGLFRLPLYKTEKLLEFDEHGTYPVYLSRPSHLLDLFRFSTQLVPTTACWYLLFTNPYPISLEPLFLPAFLILGLVGIWKCFKNLANNSLTIYEVRLKLDGVHTEISFYNFLGFKSKNKKFTIDIRDFAPPPLHPDSIPLRGDLFPHLIQGFEIMPSNKLSNWVKYNTNIRRKFFIPKRYSYMQQELMVNIMNGCYIRYNV